MRLEKLLTAFRGVNVPIISRQQVMVLIKMDLL